MNDAIEVKNLQKSYGNHVVLAGLNFSVRHGEIFALLGTNGAGKTTTLECIEGLRKYDSGSITVNGKMGIQLQSASLPEHIRAMEAIRLFAGWNKVTVDPAMLNRLGIDDISQKQYYQMSTGQKRRLHLALAMIRNPDIIFLDEPTAGLDVEGRTALHEVIRLLKAQGKTIILASHDMAEVESLCDRIAILTEGTIAFTGTVSELRCVTGRHYKIIIETNMGTRFFECDNIGKALSAVLQEIEEQDLTILDMLITCYIVPLLFFAVMGGIFTSIMPGSELTLIQSMTVFGVTMGALIGLPPSLVEIYGSGIKKISQANGVPLWLGLVLTNLSAYFHLFVMSLIIYLTAPVIFQAKIPANPGQYFCSLAVFIAVSLSIADIIGLAVKDQARTSMFSILIFLPSILLSGIMFPENLLPKLFRIAGRIFPASWGYRLMTEHSFAFETLWPLAAIFIAASIICTVLMKNMRDK